MSKIWDALRQAERDKNRLVQAEDVLQNDPVQEQPSTKCFLANAPVLVYGYGATNDPFHERTEALSTNARGGMIVLTTAVNPGETLLLTNELSLKEEKCVVREVSADFCGTRIVFEFLQPESDFWDAIQI
jgi:hypothetical protein